MAQRKGMALTIESKTAWGKKEGSGLEEIVKKKTEK